MGEPTFSTMPICRRYMPIMGVKRRHSKNRTYRKHYSTIFPAEVRINQSTGETTSVLYVGGDAYTAPVALINGEDHYLHRDHLGSVLAISDSKGKVVEERQFTAWGKVEEFKKTELIQEDFTDSILSRGFTGHEHFSEIALIHMTGVCMTRS